MGLWECELREDIEEAGAFQVASTQIEETLPQVSIANAFRNSMRNLAAGVSVVTVGSGGNSAGFTATSVISLSVDTPTLLVSINRNSASWSLVQSSGRFAVNILSSAHSEIAETFAGRRGLTGSDRYIDPRWQQSAERVPRLIDALSVIECDLEEAITRYSHALLIGREIGRAHV